MNNPKITVLMPVYNGEKYLAEAIESILNQTYKDFDFLIINDGSTDNSVKIIESYNDPRIRLVKNKKNFGIVYSLNKGIDLAKGEYIARMDVDDVSLPERLEKQVAFVNYNPNIAVIGSYFNLIDKKGYYIGKIKWPIGFENNLFYVLIGNNPVGHPGVMYRKKVVEEIGSYHGKYAPAEDFDLWLRIYLNGYHCENIPEFLTDYRVHSEQESVLQKNTQRKKHNLAFYDFYNKLTKDKIEYRSIEQYLNVVLWRTERLNKNNIESIIDIFLTIFEKLKSIHNCNDNIKKRFLKRIIYFNKRIFYPFQLLVLIRVILKKNIFDIDLIRIFLKLFLKRLHKCISR